MIAVITRPRRVALMALPLLILAASQAGHLLAWRLRRGPQALPAAGSGVHGYVPNLTGVTFGTAGAAVLAALYVIGAARAAPLGRAMLRAAPASQLRRDTRAGRGRIPLPAPVRRLRGLGNGGGSIGAFSERGPPVKVRASPRGG